jgi:hypothetical protein
MPIALRVFVLDENGRLSRFARTRWKRLWDGEAELPERAGLAVRFLEVMVETRNGLPVGIHDVHGVILKLDPKGRLKPDHREHMMRSAGERLGAYLKNLPRSGRGTILPAGHIFVRRREEASEEAYWAPSVAQIGDVRALLAGRSRK